MKIFTPIIIFIMKILSYAMFPIVLLVLRDVELADEKGNFVKPFAKGCDNVDMEGIALSLSRLKRFFGRTRLSVAQHCVNIAKVFLYQGKVTQAKQALLHESSEAFMGDLVTPVKKLIFIFKLLEGVINKKVFRCYDLSYPVCDEVEKLDKSIVYNEAIVNMGNREHWLSFGKKCDDAFLLECGVDLEPWSEEKAYKEFIEMYHMLFDAENTMATQTKKVA